MIDLITVKEKIFAGEPISLETKNLVTGWIGYASFLTSEENKIKVFEGSGDGSDDKVYTYDEFLKKYSYKVKKEV